MPQRFDVEFLEWLQEATERAWDLLDETAGPSLGPRWLAGTRWTSQPDGEKS